MIPRTISIGRISGNAAVTAVLLFMTLPILIIVVLSFSSASYLTFPPPAFGAALVSRLFRQRGMARRDRPQPDRWPHRSSCWPPFWARSPRSASPDCRALLAHARRGADPVAADRAGDRRGDRHLLRILALRAGRHAGRAGARAHLPGRAVRRHQRQRQPGRLRPAAGAGGASLGRDALGHVPPGHAAADPAGRAGGRAVRVHHLVR